MMNEHASADQGKHFPFSRNKHYRVIKQWYKNGTTFEPGQELVYEDLIYNHYDDVKIFCFKDTRQGYKIHWPCSVHEIDTWKEYFEKMK